MTEQTLTFADLGLPETLLSAISDLGFTQPSPIQQACIPHLLAGKDILGMAQTGSGKTAAFALPLLTRIDVEKKYPQLLVMAPTRELAIQVADACEQFAKNLQGINIVTVYGGQRYDIQLRALKQGAQVVVGTPGRILDHIRRKTLDLSALQAIVLDEADEMLRMGFIEDVETVMAELPENHQTALFSATMPEAIRRITHRFMHDPKEIKIQSTQQTAPDITQSYWLVNGFRKGEALVRFLEVEEFDAAIIFARTKNATVEITELLEKNNLRCAALNGDMTQQLREQTLERLRNGRLDILVATDVAARGIDIDRISLVVNYDIPLDPESYVHRIGRTGRAGRAGRALLFVDARERRHLRNIERLMKKTIDEVQVPNHEQLQTVRREKFRQKITAQLEHHDLELYRSLLEDIFAADQSQEDIAAAMMMLLQGKQKLILPPDPDIKPLKRERERRENPRSAERRGARNSLPMDIYRIEVGRADGVEVGHIVGAIANEGNLSSRYIGHIKLYEHYATVELPTEMPKALLHHFQRTYVVGKPMKMSLLEAAATDVRQSHARKSHREQDDFHQKRRSGKERKFKENRKKFDRR